MGDARRTVRGSPADRAAVVPPVSLLAGQLVGDLDLGADDATAFATAVFSAGADVTASVLAAALQTFHALAENAPAGGRVRCRRGAVRARSDR